MSQPYPLPPKNIMVTAAYHVGACDVRFDSPLLVPENSEFRLLGVDIWRANDAPEGTYEKLNISPVGSLCYRDLTEDELVTNEDVTNQFLSRGTDESKSWVFQVRNRPIIKAESQFDVASGNEDVEVKIYNPQTLAMQKVPIAEVRGDIGIVELIKTAWFDQVTQKNIPALLPDFTNPSTRVTCTYHWGRRLYTLRLLERTYYKVSTVGQKQDGTIVRTPLSVIEPVTPWQQESLDWIWAEAIYRNKWILEQGGDRVLVFLRKWLGTRCGCWNDVRGIAKSDCLSCYGTGYLGGYEGPFELMVAPPEAEKRLTYDTGGLKYEFQYSSWTVDTPLLREWDIICKRDGTRFVVAAVNQQGQRDRILSQAFSMSLLSEGDIAYRIPVNPESRRTGPIPEIDNGHDVPKPSSDSPQINEDRKQTYQDYQKGRTDCYENLQ